MIKKKLSLGVTITLMAITATITLTMTYQYSLSVFNKRIQDLSDRQQMYSKLSEVDQSVRANFYKEIDDEQLNNGIISGYVSGLEDRFSYYLSAEDTKEWQDDLSGKKVGIGIDYKVIDDNIVITRVHEKSPAYLAGVSVGDIIVQVDDKKDADENNIITSESLTAMVDAIKGDLGSKVVLKVKRDDQKMDINITRDNYEVQSMSADILDNNIGYIRIWQFNSNSYDQFCEKFDFLEKNNITSLIIDVRDNVGGSLESVSKILDKILPAGKIVSQTDKSGETKVLYTSDSKQISLPMAVIVNNNTASAAELLAADIQDYKKGVVIGTQTFGKGTMQQLISLTDGSSINLTIAKFNSAVSPNFNEVGIKPDIPINLTDEQIKYSYKLSYTDDPQIKASMSYLITNGGTIDNNPQAPIINEQPDNSDENTQSTEEQSDETSSTTAKSYDKENITVAGYENRVYYTV